MAKKQVKSKTPKAEFMTSKQLFDDINTAISVYERCRYGTVAPDDAKLPAAHAASALRAKYEADKGEPEWGEILLSVAVAARRSGLTPVQIYGAIVAAADRWVEAGQESHPAMPHAVPGTHPGSLLD